MLRVRQPLTGNLQPPQARPERDLETMNEGDSGETMDERSDLTANGIENGRNTSATHQMPQSPEGNSSTSFSGDNNNQSSSSSADLSGQAENSNWSVNTSASRLSPTANLFPNDQSINEGQARTEANRRKRRSSLVLNHPNITQRTRRTYVDSPGRSAVNPMQNVDDSLQSPPHNRVRNASVRENSQFFVRGLHNGTRLTLLSLSAIITRGKELEDAANLEYFQPQSMVDIMLVRCESFEEADQHLKDNYGIDTDKCIYLDKHRLLFGDDDDVPAHIVYLSLPFSEAQKFGPLASWKNQFAVDSWIQKETFIWHTCTQNEMIRLTALAIRSLKRKEGAFPEDWRCAVARIDDIRTARKHAEVKKGLRRVLTTMGLDRNEEEQVHLTSLSENNVRRTARRVITNRSNN